MTIDNEVIEARKSTENQQHTTENYPFKNTDVPKKKNYNKDNDAKLEEAFKILQESAARKEIPPDSCAIYSQHVGNKLRSYNDYTRVQVEHAINNILFAADMGKYDSNPTFPQNDQNPVPLYNYPPTQFYNNNQFATTPLPSPTFTDTSTSSSYYNVPSPVPSFPQVYEKL